MAALLSCSEIEKTHGIKRLFQGLSLTVDDGARLGLIGPNGSGKTTLLEILAGIPTVVYGFFAALTVAPWVRSAGESVGLEVASESALAAGLVMGIMIIALVSSLADDAIHAVTQLFSQLNLLHT